MKPYGREKKIKGSGIWKTDYHIHQRNRKVHNWWEGMCNFVSRSMMKQKIKNDLRNE